MVGRINKNQVNLHIKFGNCYLIFKTKVIEVEMCPSDTWSQIIEDLAHRLKLVAYEERRGI